MFLANKSVIIVIALLVIALTGLLAVQVLLLNFAIELKDQAFSRNVLTAISTVAQQVEAAELATGITDVLMFDPAIPSHKVFYQSLPHRATVFDTSAVDTMEFLALNLDGQISTLASTNLPAHFDTTQTMTFIIQSSRQTLLRKVVSDLTLLSKEPIAQRIKNSKLDSLLNNSLREVGIEVGHHYGIISAATDSLSMESSAGFSTQLRQSKYRTRLFPLDLMPPNFDLVLYFPTGRVFLYKQVWPLLVSSVIFSLLILACFAHTIRTIAAQRRLSSQMVGFINNMTHEFKTPISTVALACEAIARPDVLAQQTTLLRYNGMIRQENSRMHKQVEKILQMAQLERGEYELNRQPLDIHALIENVGNNFSLQLEQRRGKLAFDLSAPEHQVQADMIHLTNVVQNLLDNAIKYSPESPEISILTWNEKQGIMIRVSDKGTGISEQHQKHVFEKYFRCPTGNRHDVKGFGLGLSYVELLVDAHQGEVGLTSRPGLGTNVDIYLPLASSTQETSADEQPGSKP